MACADGSTSHRPGFKQTSYSNLKYKFMNKTFIRQVKRSFTFLFMLGLCAIWSPRAAAQNRSLPQVTIRMDRVPMSQIMSEIERQTKYLFVTGSDVKTDRITSLDVTAVPLTEALNRMVAGADLTYAEHHPLRKESRAACGRRRLCPRRERPAGHRRHDHRPRHLDRYDDRRRRPFHPFGARTFDGMARSELSGL